MLILAEETPSGARPVLPLLGQTSEDRSVVADFAASVAAVLPDRKLASVFTRESFRTPLLLKELAWGAQIFQNRARTLNLLCGRNLSTKILFRLARSLATIAAASLANASIYNPKCYVNTIVLIYYQRKIRPSILILS